MRTKRYTHSLAILLTVGTLSGCDPQKSPPPPPPAAQVPVPVPQPAPAPVPEAQPALQVAAAEAVLPDTPFRCELVFEEFSAYPSYAKTQPLPGEAINHRTFGDPKNPAIVLVHGLGGNLNSWYKIGPMLAEKFFVITYDQRGHGQTSARGDTNFSAEIMARDLAALLDHLKIGKAAVVGHSMGGRTVLKFGALYPDRTTAVFVEDMHAKGLNKRRAYAINDVVKVDQLKEKIIAADAKTYRELNTSLKQSGMSLLDRRHVLKTAVAEPGKALRLGPSYGAVSMYSSQGLMEDLTGAMKAVTSPLVFLAAEWEPVLFGVGVEHIRENKPDAEVVVIERTGHGIHGDRPDKFVEEIMSRLLPDVP